MIFLKLFLIFFKIGLFTFGGGHAMIPMISDEIVAEGWLTSAQITQLIAVSESSPGPFAINIATFVGAEFGFAGSVCATLGVIMPSFLIILLIAALFQTFSQNKVVKKILSGMKPVIIGLIFSAGAVILFDSIFPSITGSTVSFDYVQLILFVFLFLLNKLLGKKLHPILLIILAGALGVLIYSFYTPLIFDL